MPKTYKLLEVKDLNTSFKIDAGKVLAVNGVSFELNEGKILGIVGESGSGKSVTAYSIMGILDKNGEVSSGKIIYKGTDLLKISEREMRKIRGNKISIIFQDAMTSLNPTFTIGNQLAEAILTHSKDPIEEKLYPIKNDIVSDRQRISSIKKGISHHPDNQTLVSDLAFVEEKLVKDLDRLEKMKVTAAEELAKNEAAKMEEYKANVPEYNAKIQEAISDYQANKDVRNPVPSEADMLKDRTYRGYVARINLLNEEISNKTAKNEAYIKAHSGEFENVDPETKKSDEYKTKFKAYKNDVANFTFEINGLTKEKIATEKTTDKYKRKFINDVVMAPVRELRQKIADAKEAKRNYYYECKSAYRETRYSAYQKALKMLIEVGITEPKKRLKQYPFELSGGMLQRCMIAMALVQKPDILIADEPTTALDVTIQAQILDLLKKLQKEYGMAILIITHDLGVVAQICDEVDIMYAGRIVERGTVEDIFYNPQHEYTKGLINSMPKLNTNKGLLEPIPGNPVDLFCLPKGCAFCSRCKKCMNICLDKYPEEVKVNEEGHSVSCWEVIKRLHEEGKIDIEKGKPEGKPLIYNGAIISNFKKTKKVVLKNDKEKENR